MIDIGAMAPHVLYGGFYDMQRAHNCQSRFAMCGEDSIECCGR